MLHRRVSSNTLLKYLMTKYPMTEENDELPNDE